MPYSGPADPKLPASIEKLPLAKRRQWVGAFNGSYSKDQDEGKAFRIANAAVKEVGMAKNVPVQCPCGATVEVEQGEKEFACKSCETSRLLTWAEKDGDMAYECGPSMPYRPYGGAVSFDEVEAFLEASQISDNVWYLKRRFDDIWDNIWKSDDPEVTIDQKAGLTRSAVADLVSRIEAGPDAAKDDGLLDRVRGFLGGEKQETKREAGADFKASDYADVPDAAKPSTWKLRLAETRSGNFTVAQVGRAITAMQPSGFRGNRVTLGNSKASVTARISAAIGKISGATPAQKAALKKRLMAVKTIEDVDNAASAFYVLKGADGRDRFLALTTNRYEDRENEILSESAHREFEHYLKENPDECPELRVWHVPGSRLGQVDLWAYADGFVITSGTFDAGMEKEAERLAQFSEPLGMSHGFVYSTDDLRDGVYYKYRTREVSVLPRRRCANPWTSFGVEFEQEVKQMGLDAQMREAFVEIFGEEKTTKIEGSVATLSKDLEAAGITYKALGDVLAAKHDDGGGGNGNGDGDDDDDGDGDDKGASSAGAGGDSADAGAGAGDGGGGGDGEEAGKAMAAAVAETVQKAITATLDERLAPLEARMAELSKSMDEKVADAMKPKIAPTNGTRPSDSPDNLVDDKTGKEMTKDDPGDGEGRPVNPARKYVEMVAEGHVAQ